jgi:hypothetical protein
MIEEAHRRQLQADGSRPLAVNLAEGLALSESMRLRELLRASEASQKGNDKGE